MTEEEKKVIEFLRDYTVLCKKYKIGLNGCGCCGSPFLKYRYENKKRYICDINYDDEKNDVIIGDSEEEKTIDEFIKEMEK